MRIGLGQMNTAWEAQEKNLRKISRFTRRAARESCDILVLPEMCLSGFSMNRSGAAVRDRGPEFRQLAALAKKNGITLIAGLAVENAAEAPPNNAAIVFGSSGEIVAEYAKIHPFTYAGEDRVYQAGTAAVIFELNGYPFSTFICYDLRFPELFRAVARDVCGFFVLANWPASRKAHWEALLLARAIENQCFVIGVNRVGRDGNGLCYPGGSAVFDPMGKRIASSGSDETITVGEIDPADTMRVRSAYPFLKDM